MRPLRSAHACGSEGESRRGGARAGAKTGRINEEEGKKEGKKHQVMAWRRHGSQSQSVGGREGGRHATSFLEAERHCRSVSWLKEPMRASCHFKEKGANCELRAAWSVKQEVSGSPVHQNVPNSYVSNSCHSIF